MRKNGKELDSMLNELKGRFPAEEFASAESFKAEFFRRARAMEAAKLPWFRRPVLRAAAAALLLAGIAGIFYLPKESAVPFLDDDFRVKIRETVALLGNQSGVGFLGDDLFTFNRQNWSAPNRILRVSIFDGSSREVAGLVLALGENDFAEVKSDAVFGEVLAARTGDGTDVVETDLSVRLEDGKVVKLHDVVIGGCPDKAAMVNGYRVEHKLVAI